MKKYFFTGIMLLLFFVGCNNKDKNQNENTSNDNNKLAVASPSSGETNGDNRSIRLVAKPDTITIDAAKTAVIVVDMQNDFGGNGGMFDRAGINISMIQKAIAPTANVLAAARQAGIKIIYLKMGYHNDLSDLGSEESPNRVRHLQFMHVGDTINAPDGSKSRILIRNTWNTDIVSDLKPQQGDIIIDKTRFSGFYQTGLDSTLKQLGKKYLIFTGCTTSICVESTVRDAMFRDYSSVVLEDCTAEPIGYDLPRSNHEASILAIQTLFGWISSSEEFIKSIGEEPVKKSKKQ